MMSDNKSILKADEETQNENVEASPGEIERDPYTDLVRLLVGGIFEGGSVFLNWLDANRDRQRAAPTSDQVNEELTPGRQAGYAAMGFILRSAEAARINLNNALYVSEAMSGIFLRPARRIFKSPPFRPLRNQFERLVARGEAEVEDWIQVGASEQDRSRQLARDTASTTVNDVIQYLSTSPALEALIKAQIDQMAMDLPQTTQIDVLVRVLANNYITYLNDNPEQVQSLIRSQGDNYLDHLSERPEQVKTLIQGQSRSLIEEVRDEVRERMVTSDSALELLARSLFRRRPRSELPGPSPEVRVRATTPRLEGDFPRITGDNHGQADSAGPV
jgi:hypothetical protein